MTTYSAIFPHEGELRRVWFQAATEDEARSHAVRWGAGLEGEAEFSTTKQALPEAYNLEDTRRLLGGISRSLVYQMIYDERLERVPGVRRLLITRRSIERCAAGRS